MACPSDDCPSTVVWNETSSFTCQQFLDYCRSYAGSNYVVNLASTIVNCGFAVGGPIGLVSYFLMALALKHMQFNASSRIYHMAMVYAEVLHMISMGVAGALQMTGYRNSRSRAFVVFYGMLVYGWQIGDTMKMTVSFLTVCIAVERCIAGTFPFLYRKITRRPIAVGFVLISLGVSCLNLYMVYLGRVVQQPDGTYAFTTSGNDRAVDAFLRIVSGIKIACSIVVLVAVVVLLVRVRQHAKRVSATSSHQINEHKLNRRQTLFCIWTSVILIVDHTAWALYKTQNSVPISVVTAADLGAVTYEQAMHGVGMAMTTAYFRMVQALVGVVAHCGRFLVYYAVHKAYRNAVASIFRPRRASVANTSGFVKHSEAWKSTQA